MCAHTHTFPIHMSNACLPCLLEEGKRSFLIAGKVFSTWGKRKHQTLYSISYPQYADTSPLDYQLSTCSIWFQGSNGYIHSVCSKDSHFLHPTAYIECSKGPFALIGTDLVGICNILPFVKSLFM